MPKALEDADRFYARCIFQTQKEMKELSRDGIDHLVVATLLMTNYEVHPTPPLAEFYVDGMAELHVRS